MKIALASSHAVTRNIEYNTASVIRAMAQYRGRAELVLFGESMLQGIDV